MSFVHCPHVPRAGKQVDRQLPLASVACKVARSAAFGGSAIGCPLLSPNGQCTSPNHAKPENNSLQPGSTEHSQCRRQ